MRPFFGSGLSTTALLSLASKEVYVIYLILSSASLKVDIAKASSLRSEIGVEFVHLRKNFLFVVSEYSCCKDETERDSYLYTTFQINLITTNNTIKSRGTDRITRECCGC